MYAGVGVNGLRTGKGEHRVGIPPGGVWGLGFLGLHTMLVTYYCQTILSHSCRCWGMWSEAVDVLFVACGWGFAPQINLLVWFLSPSAIDDWNQTQGSLSGEFLGSLRGAGL